MNYLSSRMAALSLFISSGVACRIPCCFACSIAFFNSSSSVAPRMTWVHPDDGSTLAHSTIFPIADSPIKGFECGKRYIRAGGKANSSPKTSTGRAVEEGGNGGARAAEEPALRLQLRTRSSTGGRLARQGSRFRPVPNASLSVAILRGEEDHLSERRHDGSGPFIPESPGGPLGLHAHGSEREAVGFQGDRR